MNSLIKFFSKIRFFLLFVFLQFFCFYLIYNNSYYHKTSLVNSSSVVSGWVYEKRDNISSYFSLKQQNDSLVNQNKSLLQNSLNQTFNVENYTKAEKGLIYELIPGRIINKTKHKFNNYLTLNVGKKNGVSKEMGVITTGGIVGIIHNVSGSYSTVLSVNSEKMNVAVRVLPENAIGILKWNPQTNKTYVSNLPNYTSISPKDSVVTQGGAGYFPENTFVGLVENIESIPGESYKNAIINCPVDFNTLYNVYVIKNYKKAELDSLQNEIIDN